MKMLKLKQTDPPKCFLSVNTSNSNINTKQCESITATSSFFLFPSRELNKIQKEKDVTKWNYLSEVK